MKLSAVNIAESIDPLDLVDLNDTGNIFITDMSFLERWWERLHADLAKNGLTNATIHVTYDPSHDLTDIVTTYRQLSQFGAKVYVWISEELAGNFDEPNVVMVKCPPDETSKDRRFLIFETANNGRALITYCPESVSGNNKAGQNGVLITKHSAVHGLVTRLDNIISTYT